MVHLCTCVIHQYSLFFLFRPKLLCGNRCHPCRERGEDGRVHHLSLHLRGGDVAHRAPGHVHQTRVQADVGPAARTSASAGALPRPGLLGDSGRHRPSAVCWSPVLGPSGRLWEAPAKYIRLSMRNRENCWSLCFLSQRLQEKELDVFQNIHKNFGQKKKKKNSVSK